MVHVKCNGTEDGLIEFTMENCRGGSALSVNVEAYVQGQLFTSVHAAVIAKYVMSVTILFVHVV